MVELFTGARPRPLLFVGSGPSCTAGFPDWESLAKDLVDTCRSRGIEVSAVVDSPTVDDLIAHASECKLGLKNDFTPFIFKKYARHVGNDKVPNTVKLMVKLDVAGIITTNFDPLLEDAWGHELQHSVAPLTASDAPHMLWLLSEGQTFLWKLHGDASSGRDIVLGRREYDDMIHSKSKVAKGLTVIFGGRSVLFIGFGMRDQHVVHRLAEVGTILGGEGAKHYALVGSAESKMIKQFSDYNVLVIPYDTKNNHQELERILELLPKRGGPETPTTVVAGLEAVVLQDHANSTDIVEAVKEVQAQGLELRGEFERAIELGQAEAEQVFRSEDVTRAWALGTLVRCYYYLGQWSKAQQIWKFLDAHPRLLRAVKVRAPAVAAEIVLHRGVWCKESGDIEKARRFFRIARRLAKTSGHHEVHSRTVRYQGTLELFTRGYERPAALASVSLFEKALVLARQSGSKREEADSLKYLGVAYSYLRRFPDADRCFQDSLHVCEEAHYAKGRAWVHFNLCQLRRRQAAATRSRTERRQRLVEARKALGEAQSFFQASGLQEGLAYYYLESARLGRLEGKHQESVKHLLSALDLARSLPHATLEKEVARELRAFKRRRRR